MPRNEGATGLRNDTGKLHTSTGSHFPICFSRSSKRQNTEVPDSFPNLSLYIFVLLILFTLQVRRMFVHDLHQLLLAISKHGSIGVGPLCGAYDGDIEFRGEQD